MLLQVEGDVQQTDWLEITQEHRGIRGHPCESRETRGLFMLEKSFQLL